MSSVPVDSLADDEDEPSSLTAPQLEEEQVGQRLGKYELVAELGHGGMAVVYLARMSGPHGFTRWFAVKRIHPHLARDERFVNMFLDEARIAAALHHANVAQVIELGQDDKSYFLVMEYLHGEHLGSIVGRFIRQRGDALPWALAAHIVASAAEGLHHAHEATDNHGQRLELVHRDVSPHNIFVTYDGQVKITDFGIAKAAGRLTHTQTGGLKGKLPYMSPEQVAHQELDRRTDIFALGIVLHEITTGRRLFRAPSEVQTIMRITSGRIPKPGAARDDYPPHLESIALRALSRNPADRYQTAAELAEDLRAFIVTEPDGATTTQDLVTVMGELFEGSRLSKEEWQRKPVAGVAPKDATDTEVDTQTTADGAEGTDASDLSRVRTKAVGRRWPVWAMALALLATAVGLGAWAGLASRDAEDAADVVGTAAADAPSPAPVPAPAATAIVRVDTDPAGATVAIDGVAHGASPVLLEDISLGEHALAITLEGHETVAVEVDVDEEREHLHYALVALPAVAGQGGGEETVRAERGEATLSLVTVPWAKAWVNGELVGETPIIRRRVPSGRIRLRLQAEGAGPIRNITYRARPGQALHKRERL